MNFDENLDSFGGSGMEQDDQWLDDLKSLLDEDPGTAPSPGNMPAHSAPIQQRPVSTVQNGQPFGRNPGYDPDHSYRQAQPYSQPQAQPYSQPQAQPYSQPYRQPQTPNYQNQDPRLNFSQQMPYPDFDAAPQQEEKPAKKGYGVVITLSILIILEALAIAAVVLHWMQWMQ